MANDIHSQVLELLLDKEAPSRNQDFERFSGPQGQRIYRLYRIYLSLLAELEQASQRPEVRVSLSREEGGYYLVIEDPRLAYRRNCLLPLELAPAFVERLRAWGREVGGNDADELLPVVDENDQVLGTRRREDVHALGLLHRAVHVLVFDRKGRLYLQKRSAAKDTHPGKWTTSASGHVDPGEDYEQAASRELQEELGLRLPLEEVGAIPACPRTENEFVRVFRVTTSQEPLPHPIEISEGRWFELEAARTLAADPARATPSLGAVLELV